MKLKEVLFQGLLAAVYVVLTLMSVGLSYGPVQFRVSEVLLILVFFNPKHVIGLLLGTFIANVVGSPYGLDWFVGTLASLVALGLMIALKRWRYFALLMPTLSNALFIGWLIWFSSHQTVPFIPAALTVGFGEFIVTFVLGSVILRWIEQNKSLKEVLS